MTDEDIIYAYTRAQAIEDGEQVDVSEIAAEAGIRYPAYVTVPSNVFGQDEAGRLWDILWMCRDAIRRAPTDLTRIGFSIYVRNNNRSARMRQLVAECGPVDIDDPRPAITIMMPGED